MDCEEQNKILNPITKRCITINGPVHKRLIKEGKLQPSCKENEVINPKTKRCIKIASYLYKKLVKEGVLNPDGRRKSGDKKSGDKKSGDKKTGDKKSGDKSQEKKTQRNCKNIDTFLLFEHTKDIPDSDFIQTADGYCFSSKELIAYVNDSNFKNKNPHIPAFTPLFKKQEIDTLLKDHPNLLKRVKEYFEKEIKTQKENDEIFEKTIDVLYMVGNAGRTCYFNNLSSHAREDSSFFQRSIESLQELAEQIRKLKTQTEKTAYRDVNKLVQSANRGEACIHGVGIILMNLFIQYFIRLKNVKYDPFKTGLYFYKSPKNGILLCSAEHRFSPLPKRFLRNMPDFEMKIRNLDTTKPDMITERNEKSKHYQEMCNYEPYLVTENTLDEWSELADWRKIKFGSNMCFDILYVIKVITDNLNNSKNNNPDPKFPTNPFTQSHFTQDEFKLIKYTVEDNYVKINPAIRCFLYNPEFWVYSSTWKNRYISKMDVNHRFVRLNNIIGGELHCHGMWNMKSTPKNDVENQILLYLNTARPEILRLLVRKPSETVPDKYYYDIPKSFLTHGDFIIWD